jgi:pimeloyl-ACP methyl ester carboxylesterase
MAESKIDTFDVPVKGGDLRVAAWGDGPPVFGIHGVTASLMSWSAIIEALGGSVRFIAPDLRGRGESGDLPGPYGMGAHVEDALAVLDHLGIESVPVVGMSMGGWVATLMASKHPDRVESILLLDGGINLPVPPGLDPDQFLEAVLASSLQRLSMTFASVDEYIDYWRPHPALSVPGGWSEHTEAYLLYDLKGSEPQLRSKVSEAAVREGSRDQLTNPDVIEALAGVKCPVHLLRSPRGLQNEPGPLLSDFLVEEARKLAPQLTEELVEDTNHYTLCLSKTGAETVADRIRALPRR